MAKILKVSFPQKCIGCELCVMEVQKQLGRAGLEGSLIRVFRNSAAHKDPFPKKDPDSNDSIPSALVFTINLDPQVNTLDVKKIADICPTAVFTIEEVEEREGYGLLG